MPVLVLYLVFHYEEDDEIYNYHDTSGPLLQARVHRVELDEKNYDAQTLAQDLQTRINNQLINGQQTVTVTYDPNSGKIIPVAFLPK